MKPKIQFTKSDGTVFIVTHEHDPVMYDKYGTELKEGDEIEVNYRNPSSSLFSKKRNPPERGKVWYNNALNRWEVKGIKNSINLSNWYNIAITLIKHEED